MFLKSNFVFQGSSPGQATKALWLPSSYCWGQMNCLLVFLPPSVSSSIRLVVDGSGRDTKFKGSLGSNIPSLCQARLLLLRSNPKAVLPFLLGGARSRRPVGQRAAGMCPWWPQQLGAHLLALLHDSAITSHFRRQFLLQLSPLCPAS